MLFHIFSKNETPSNPSSLPFFHPFRSSASSDDIFSHRKPSTTKRQFSSDLPLIYQNVKINKAPSINHFKQEIISVSRQSRLERLQMINSLHKSSLRNALLQTKTPYNTLLITASYDRNNTYTKHNRNEKRNINLNSSSMQDTSHCLNNSIDNLKRFDVNFYQTFAKEVKKQKMSLKIGSLFAFNTIKPNSLTKRCLNLNIIEGLSIANKKRCEQIKEDYQNKVNELENYEYRLLYNKRLLEEGYCKIYNEYLMWLKNKIKIEAEKLENYIDREQELEIHVSKLKIEVNRIKKVFMKLCDIRNFIIYVKEKKEYNENIITAIEKDNFSQLDNISKEQIEKYKKYLNPFIPIFKTIDDFIYCYKELEKKGLLLLVENEKKTTSIQIMKEELINLTLEGEKQEKFITQQINQKQKILDIQKSIYLHLIKQINSLNSVYKKSSTTNNSHNEQTHKSVTSSIDRELFATLKYQSRIKSYPAAFSVLYVELVHQIKLIIQLKVIDEEDLYKIGLIKTHVDLVKLFSVKLTKKNELIVSTACLILLKIYERASIFLYEKHSVYLANPLLKEEITRLTLQRQNYIKIKNAEEQRKLLAEQRKLELNKTILKNNKTIITSNRKVPEKLYLIQSIRRISKKKKENKNEELHFGDFITLENGE